MGIIRKIGGVVKHNQIHRIPRERQLVRIAHHHSVWYSGNAPGCRHYFLRKIRAVGKRQPVADAYLKLSSSGKSCESSVKQGPLICQQSAPKRRLKPALKALVS
jgi:hypothetical protein